VNEQTLQLAGIVQNSIVDGPGIRLALFTQGCPHHCPGCHNPETHPFEGGTPTTTEELMARVADDPLLSGITLSGGEPFCQAAALAPFARWCKERGLETAAYSGYTFEQLLSPSKEDENVAALLASLDILIDGPFLIEQRSLELRFRGSRNQRTVDVPASLKAGEVVPDRSERWNGEGGL